MSDKSVLKYELQALNEADSSKKKENIAYNICNKFNTQRSVFSAGELDIIHDILFILTSNISDNIRMILAENLKDNRKTPKSIIQNLVNDDNILISQLVLEDSQVLTDDDLKDIISSTMEVARLNAITRRQNISEDVSQAIADKNIADVSISLLNNENARIAHETLKQLTSQFDNSQDIITKLTVEGKLNVSVAKKLISIAENNIIQNYSAKDTKFVEEEARKASSEFLFKVIPSFVSNDNSSEIVDQLHGSKNLNHSILLRSLCRAEIGFFSLALSKLSDIPLKNVQKLLYNNNAESLASLFRIALIPDSLIDAAVIITKIIIENPPMDDNKKEYALYLSKTIMQNRKYLTTDNMKYCMKFIDENIKDPNLN